MLVVLLPNDWFSLLHLSSSKPSNTFVERSKDRSLIELMLQIIFKLPPLNNILISVSYLGNMEFGG